MENIPNDEICDSSDESIDSQELDTILSEVGQVFERRKGAEKTIERQPTAKQPVAKRAGRPKDTPLQLENKAEQKKREKYAKKVVKTTKEKYIYMMPNDDGGWERVRAPKPISNKEMRKIENEKVALKKEEELGRKLTRLKNGKPRMPRERTQKQIDAFKKCREARAVKQAVKKGVQKVEQKQNLKEVVKEAVVEIAKQPAAPKPRQKTIEEQYNDFFG